MFRKPCSQLDGREELLGRALRALPDPEVTRDFNDRIHRELAQESRLTRSYWRMLRPALSAMVGSFAVTLMLLSLFGGSPQLASKTDIPSLKLTSAGQSGVIDNTDSVIERADLTSASIRTLLAPASEPTHVLVPDRGSAPKMRAAPFSHHLQGA